MKSHNTAAEVQHLLLLSICGEWHSSESNLTIVLLVIHWNLCNLETPVCLWNAAVL